MKTYLTDDIVKNLKWKVIGCSCKHMFRNAKKTPKRPPNHTDWKVRVQNIPGQPL